MAEQFDRKKRKSQKLYVNQFSLFPLICRKVESLKESGNWLITGYSEPLDMEYEFYFGMNIPNDKLVEKLKEGVEMVVYGTLKRNRGGSIILRAKQIIVAEE